MFRVLNSGDTILNGPDTRKSLLASLNDSAAESAWNEFVVLYRPLIIRVARAKGVQDADAEDLAQEVLTRVERSVGSFESQGPGSFRRWLSQVTRNLVINFLTRNKELNGTGDSNVQSLLRQHADVGNQTGTLFDFELRRIRFQQAAEVVSEQVARSIWQCFFLTAVKDEPVAAVAKKLNKSEGAVRVARCRVLAKIRSEVQSYDTE